MIVAFAKPTVARAILLVVGGALLTMEFSLVGYRAIVDWRDI